LIGAALGCIAKNPLHIHSGFFYVHLFGVMRAAFSSHAQTTKPTQSQVLGRLYLPEAPHQIN
jgi:hypothetical protein